MGAPWSKGTQPAHAKLGDDAPAFTLRGAGGREFTLDTLRGQQRALLIFYPQDMTGG